MANIIRVKLPDGVHRFKPFTVADYRDFLLVRNDIVTNSEEQQEIVDELMEELFPDYEKSVRGYIFMKVFTSSIGKTLIPLEYECRECGKKHRLMLNLGSKCLESPSIDIDDVKLKFKFLDQTSDDFDQMFLDAIDTVEYNGEIEKWSNLDEESKTQVIDAVTYEKFEEILKKLKPINIKQKIKCCRDYVLECDSILSLFKLLLNQDEIFIFYRINRLLNKSDYAMSDIMQMMPIERNIALGLLEKEAQQ
ncbi:baseplate hub [Serratia phage 92A1]|nr:baseplate hub [Serratia phage 92A1]